MKEFLLNLYTKFPFKYILKFRYMKAIEAKVWDIYEQLYNKEAPLWIGKKDYNLKKKDEKFILEFDNRFGFKKNGYIPEIYFEFETKLWHTEVEGLHIISSPKPPLFELVCELRGYTLLDNIALGDVVIDAGCSDAFIASYFGKKVGACGKVIALEPDDKLYEIARSNLKANDLDKIVSLVKKAFFNKNGTVDFSMSADGASKISAGQNTSKSVETVDLKTLLNDFNIPEEKVKLIKMDIEGAELDVLDDIVDFVTRNRDCIVAFASYHRVHDSFSWMEAEKKIAENSSVLIKTTYPIHVTTFLVNKQNTIFLTKLESLPHLKEVYDTVKN